MIRDRIFEVIYHCLAKRGAIGQLAEESGIASTSWQNVASKKQRVTEEMIEFVCRKWPNYAFYIATGLTALGIEFHTSPEWEQLTQMEFDLYDVLRKEPIDWSAEEKKWITYKFDDATFIDFLEKKSQHAALLAIESREKKQLIQSVIAQIEKEFKKIKLLKVQGVEITSEEFVEAKNLLLGLRA